MSKSGMNSGFSEEDWLNKLERKSDSTRTRKAAKTSLKIFDLFCKSQGLSREQVIKQYLIWYNPKPSSE